MTSPLSTVKIKSEQPKRAFFRKILLRRQSHSLVNTSLSTTGSLDTKLSFMGKELSKRKQDGSNKTYVDDCQITYDEVENLDVLLHDADALSNIESIHIGESLHHKRSSPLFRSSEKFAEESIWTNLTYEALEQPKYFKPLRKGKKSPKILNNIFLSQELRCPITESSDTVSLTHTEHPQPNTKKDPSNVAPMNPEEILVMEFSRDGKYLAVAGRDSRITVWQVISSPLSRLEFKNQEAVGKSYSPRRMKLKLFMSAPVFLQNPVRVFEGHTSTILCLDWSKNNFLASGSMDKTVKLWNVDRSECLETFAHNDFVTSVKFHPKDDRFFASAALDDSVQLWSILESSVAYSKRLGDKVLITALSFTPLGDHCVVGAFDGSLFVLETQGLSLTYSVEEKEGSFYHRDSRKITGIKIFENPRASNKSDTDLGRYHMLVTTNDSNVRLISLEHYKLITRFRGSHNEGSSVVASVTDDANYIISGSEDHYFYVWTNDYDKTNNKIKTALKEIYGESNGTISQKQIKLKKMAAEVGLKKTSSRPESNGTHSVPYENNSYSSIHAHRSRCNVAIFAPESTKRLLEFSDDLIYDLIRRRTMLGQEVVKDSVQTEVFKRGEIILTCDSTGLIRVFRQDSAYYARKSLAEMFKCLKRQDKLEFSDLDLLSPSRTSCRSDKFKSSQHAQNNAEDHGMSLKMKLQSKLKTPNTRTFSNVLNSSPFPSAELSVSGLPSPNQRIATSIDALSSSSTNLQLANHKLDSEIRRGRSISASEYNRARAMSLLSSSTALSSTESLLIRNQHL